MGWPCMKVAVTARRGTGVMEAAAVIVQSPHATDSTRAFIIHAIHLKLPILQLHALGHSLLYSGNSGDHVSTSSPANCPGTLIVTAMTDYNGQPGGGATPDYMKNEDDTYTDFSNYADESYADRVVSAPGTGCGRGNKTLKNS